MESHMANCILFSKSNRSKSSSEMTQKFTLSYRLPLRKPHSVMKWLYRPSTVMWSWRFQPVHKPIPSSDSEAKGYRHSTVTVQATNMWLLKWWHPRNFLVKRKNSMNKSRKFLSKIWNRTMETSLRKLKTSLPMTNWMNEWVEPSGKIHSFFWMLK